MTNNFDTCCQKFLSAIGYYAFIISSFIANDKFTSMASLALNEIEDVALEWDETNEKSIKIIKTIEKVWQTESTLPPKFKMLLRHTTASMIILIN